MNIDINQFLKEDNIQLIWDIVQTHENIKDLQSFNTSSQKIYLYLLSELNIFISSNKDTHMNLLQLNKNFIAQFLSDIIKNIQHFNPSSDIDANTNENTDANTDATTNIFSNLKLKNPETNVVVYDTYEPASNKLTYTEISNSNDSNIINEISELKKTILELQKRVTVLEEK